MPTGILSNVRGNLVGEVDPREEIITSELSPGEISAGEFTAGEIITEDTCLTETGIPAGALATDAFGFAKAIVTKPAVKIGPISGPDSISDRELEAGIIRQGSIGSLTWMETAEPMPVTIEPGVTKIVPGATNLARSGVRSPVIAPSLSPSKRLDPEPAYRSLKTLSALAQQDSSQDELKRMLAAFDYCARKQGHTQPFEITICGKGALVLKGYSSDDTQDIDVIDEIPEMYRDLAEAFSINNQARAMVPKSVGLLQRREAYAMEFDVLHVYLLSDADLLLNHLSRGLRKDIINIISSRLLDHVTKEMFMDAVVDYPHKEFLLKKFEKLCQLGGYPYGL